MSRLGGGTDRHSSESRAAFEITSSTSPGPRVNISRDRTIYGRGAGGSKTRSESDKSLGGAAAWGNPGVGRIERGE